LDPNRTLAELRDFVISERAAEDGSYAADICDRVEALDQWLTRGGFLPSAWAPGTYVLDTPPADPAPVGGTRCGGCDAAIRPGAIGGTWVGVETASSSCPYGADLVVGYLMHYPAPTTAPTPDQVADEFRNGGRSHPSTGAEGMLRRALSGPCATAVVLVPVAEDTA
jgi:hypothetical protein